MSKGEVKKQMTTTPPKPQKSLEEHAVLLAESFSMGDGSNGNRIFPSEQDWINETYRIELSLAEKWLKWWKLCPKCGVKAQCSRPEIQFDTKGNKQVLEAFDVPRICEQKHLFWPSSGAMITTKTFLSLSETSRQESFWGEWWFKQQRACAIQILEWVQRESDDVIQQLQKLQSQARQLQSSLSGQVHDTPASSCTTKS